MAQIALRDYMSEIDSLIEGGSYDEAISHCRHVLGQYPKYLEAYRLLGKAALEKEDDRAAVDLFQRVLSVDPEDFVARVGLSIVYDRQGALDDALWQMERGFELMPSNDVIQSELRRLYGRRDGVEPERIGLTRGALARMYTQGDLYSEAVAELRALLQESPDRVDLQVLLAETLWRDDQRNEAASVAERVLDALPHCLSSNLILGEIWLNSGFASDGEMLLRRAQAIDPDNLRAGALLGSTSPLAEQTTLVERLDFQPAYAPAAAPESDQVPDWLAGLAGLNLEQPESAGAPGLPAPDSGPAIELGPTEEAEVPDWLQGMGSAAEGEAVEELPDWMSALGDQAEAPVDEVALPPMEEVAGAEADEPLPDWLLPAGEPAVDESVAAEPAEQALEAGEALPDWLSQAEESAGMPEPSAEATATDWLSEIGQPPSEEAAEEVELPDWLSDLGSEAAEAAPVDAGVEQAEVPDWLQALRPQESQPEPPAVELPEVEESEAPEWMAEVQQKPASDAAMDFLRRLGQDVEVEVPEAETPPPAPSEEGMPSADDALAFLQGLSAGKEEALRAQAEQEAEARMSDIMGRRPVAEQPPGEIEAPPPAMAVPSEADAMPSADDALAFLQSLTVGKEDQLREEAERAGEERMDAIMGGKPGTSPLRPPAQPAAVEPEPEAEAEAPLEVEDMPSADDALAFLQSLTVGKEDQLREEAERAGEERMDAIMGGKPGTSPLRPPPEAAPEPELEAEPVEEAPEAAIAAMDLEGELPAADDALAFLHDLTEAPAEAPVVAEEFGGDLGTRPLEVEAEEAAPEAEAPAAVDFDYWLQTAEDEDAEPIAERYFERARQPEPAAPAPKAEPAQAEALPTPELPPVGADEFLNRLESDPDDHEARLSLARVWWAAGDRTQSLQAYQDLIESDMFLSEVAGDLGRDLETFEHADWYRTLGDAHMKLGNLAEALDAYRQALTHL